MDNYLKIINPTTVYSHWTGGNIIKTLNCNDDVRFNREIRRRGADWIEIILDKNVKGYINASKKNYTIYLYVVVLDDLSKGMKYTPVDKNQTFDSLFNFLSNGKKPNLATGLVEFKRDFEDKKELLYYGFDETLVDVKPIKYIKNEPFYLLPTSYISNSPFIETDNFKGKKGILLKTTNITIQSDKLIYEISFVLAILTVISIFLYVYSQGWIVISGFLIIIIMIVVIVITSLVLKLMTSILTGIFKQIRKRL